MSPLHYQALRQREEALLSVQALRDESETKADAVAQLEAEGSKVLVCDMHPSASPCSTRTS